MDLKALIPNSGMGTRMGDLTREHPKCMTEIDANETILSRQLKMLAAAGVRDVVITTGYFDDVLVRYARGLALPLDLTFIRNERFRDTNYIYTVYCAREALDDDVLMLHGDMVFEDAVLRDTLSFDGSCMTVSTTVPVPEKDFKAVIREGRIEAVGVEFFVDAIAAQPLYKLTREDWKIWLDEIIRFCEAGDVGCYAENALNRVAGQMQLKPLDVKDRLCREIDNPEDLKLVSEMLRGSG